MDKNIVKIKGDTSDFDRKIRKSKQNLMQFTSQGKLGMEGMTKAIGGTIAAYASWTMAIRGAARVIGDLVRTNMQFEQATANLAAVMGTTKNNVAALTTQAKQLGATTQYTAIQITDLQTNLARLGFTQQEILNSTKSVSSLATATVADLGEAANLAGAALRGFGMNSTEMDRVCSAMAVSTTKSALSFEKLATAIPIVAPVAKQFGFSIEDTLTLLAKLSDAGMDASMAATATRNIFLNMANSSGKLATALGRPIKSMEDLAPALQELKDRHIDLNEMFKLTSQRSVTAFATFVENADKLEDFKKSITDVSDAMQGMVDEQLNTLQGSATIMKSAWEGLMLTFSNSNGILKSVTDSLGNFLSKWTEFRKKNQGGTEAIALYEKGLSNKEQKAITESLKHRQEKGIGYKDLTNAINRRDEIEKQRAELLKEYEQILKNEDKGYWAKLGSIGVQAASGNIVGAAASAYAMRKGKISNREDLEKEIAKMNDEIAKEQFKIDYLKNQPETTTDDPDKKLTREQKQSKQILQIKNDEAKQLAELEKLNIQDAEEKENRIYEIKRNSLLRQRELYTEGDDKYIQTDTAIANLDTQHQARLNRGFSSKSKTYDTETGPSGYSDANIAAMLSDNEAIMKAAEIGSQTYMDAFANSLDITTFKNIMDTMVKNGLSIDQSKAEELFQKIFDGENIPDSTWTDLANSINDQLKNLGIEPIKLDIQTGAISSAAKDVAKEAATTNDMWQAAAQAISAAGSAMSAIEDPAAKVAGIVAQACASIMLGFAQAAASKTNTALGVFGWIAASLSGLATAIGMVSSIKSVTSGYAEGGMILPDGSPYQGDNIVARLNAGEGVLTAKGIQTAEQLSGKAQISVSGGNLSTKLKGGDILIALDNTNRSRGGSRGTYAYSK